MWQGKWQILQKITSKMIPQLITSKNFRKASTVPIKSQNMIRQKFASLRQFLTKSPKQLGVLGGAVNPPSEVKGQSPWKSLGYSVLNTLKLRIMTPIFIQLILIF